MQQKFQEYGEALTTKCVMEALKGNMLAMRLCMERLAPPRRERLLRFKMPPIKTLAEVSVARGAVIAGVAGGKLTPSEGQAFSEMLEGQRRILETKGQGENGGQVLVRRYIGVNVDQL